MIVEGFVTGRMHLFVCFSVIGFLEQHVSAYLVGGFESSEIGGAERRDFDVDSSDFAVWLGLHVVSNIKCLQSTSITISPLQPAHHRRQYHSHYGYYSSTHSSSSL